MSAGETTVAGAVRFRLSPLQRRLWLAGGEGAPYLARAAVLIEGELDRPALRRAVAAAVARHEILRTAFRRPSGLRVPEQVVAPAAEPAWEEIEAPDGAAGDPGDPAAAAERLLRRAPAPGADAAGDAPLAATLVRLGEARHALLLRLPALCADRASLVNLYREIAGGYAGETPAGDRPLQYADFAEWRNELLAEAPAGGGGSAEGFDPARLEIGPLPGERPRERTGERPFEPAALRVELPAERLAAAAERLETAPADLVLAAWALLVARLAGRRDLALGVVLGGRRFDELEEAVGLFAAPAPVAVKIEPGLAFAELARRLAAAVAAAEERQDEPSWQPGEAPFPVLFETGTRPPDRSAGGVSFRLLAADSVHERFRLRLACLGGGGAAAELSWDAARFDAAEARRLAARLLRLLGDALADPSRPADGLDWLSAAERHQLLAEAGDLAAADGPSEPVHRRFAAQAARHPDRPALVAGERRWSYRRLDEESARLAARLRAAGAGAESRVALCLEREDMVVGLLGALRAGAAFVPVDPAFPEARREQLLADAGAAAMVTRRPEDGPDAELGVEALAPAAAAAVPPGGGDDGRHLAYVLFTSGSTGRPKGVAVEHRAAAAYLDGVLARLALPPGSSYATVSTFSADLGHTAIFPALTTGGCLHVVPHREAADPVALAARFAAEPVDCLKIVPSHLEALLAAGDAAAVLPRRLLVLGGEAARWPLVERVRALRPDLRVLNHYGPTEATVGATTDDATTGRDDTAAVPLGRPLAGRRAYVVDGALRLLPAGMAGELCLGGAGLARGYLGRPAATAERFLPDPWAGAPGARLYRTGDRVRRLAGGRLEFLGRVDHQLKLRGYRIEPGEIEAELATHPAVAEAVVVAREDRPGSPRLVAYAVARGRPAPDPEALRAHLAGRLPEPLVPAAVVLLDALPLTANGKVDRAALPAPEAPRRTAAAAPPRNPSEQALCAIWSQVLGLPEVGVHDNFFALGGDSILAIQVIARAARHGLGLTPAQFFDNQTVAELAAVAGAAAGAAGDAAEAGAEVPLTPVQRWFFDHVPPHPEHWNQSVFLELREPLDPAVLRAGLAALARCHGALRLRFEHGDGGWRQRHAATPAPPPLAVVDLGALPQSATVPALEAAAERLQRGLDLAAGPLLAGALFRLGAGRPGRLLLVAHHLVVDGVSWRVLLAELAALHDRLAAGLSADLPPEPVSFADWSRRLAAAAGGDELAADAGYWREAAARVPPPPPRDAWSGDDAGAAAANTVAAERIVTEVLTADETEALLHQAPAAYRTRGDELLVAAAARALTDWTGTPRLWLELEGHGREDLAGGADLSRTVGWFTSHYPVLLELDGAAGPEATIRAVKEGLRRVPRRGVGFGVLRWLGPEPLRRELAALPPPRVAFNYLGRLDRALGDERRFAPAAESGGAARHPGGRRRVDLEVAARVIDGRLRMVWRYGRALHRRRTVEELAARAAAVLRELIEHCRAAEAGFTPSDFPLASLSQEQLERIAGRVRTAGGEEGDG